MRWHDGMEVDLRGRDDIRVLTMAVLAHHAIGAMDLVVTSGLDP